jgi:hypothetical protein
MTILNVGSGPGSGPVWVPERDRGGWWFRTPVAALRSCGAKEHRPPFGTAPGFGVSEGKSSTPKTWKQIAGAAEAKPKKQKSWPLIFERPAFLFCGLEIFAAVFAREV